MSRTPAKQKPQLDVGLAIVWGVAVGTALGAAFGDVVMGMVYGTAIGVVVGAIAEGQRRRQDPPSGRP